MLEIIGAIALAANIVFIARLLTGAASLSRRARYAAYVGTGAVVALLVVASFLGWFGPGAASPVPPIAYPLTAVLAVGLIAWFASPRFRDRVNAIPLPVLIVAHAGRVLGVFFLILYGAGRLPAPFAPEAGWGDILAGALAVPVAFLAASGSVRRYWIALWNALGMLDLVTAVTLGVLSAPGTPFRVFTNGPSSAAITTLPWLLIPTFLVPAYFLMHLAVVARLRAPRPLAAVAAA